MELNMINLPEECPCFFGELLIHSHGFLPRLAGVFECYHGNLLFSEKKNTYQPTYTFPELETESEREGKWIDDNEVDILLFSGIWFKN